MFVFRQGGLGQRYTKKTLSWAGARCYDFAMPRDFSAYKSVQARTKSVLENLRSVLSPAASESSIAAEAIRRLTDAGMPHTWYYNCPALVLAGRRSIVSAPGAEYVPHDEPFGENTVVTVDLSPRDGEFWGDCARTFIIEDGVVTDSPDAPEFRGGYKCLERLHTGMHEFVTADTTFRSLYEYANELIRSYGFENLDFRHNVGHSIETHLANRRFIDSSTPDKLSSSDYFTFEPHIRQRDGRWGFKHEDIYYFDQKGSLAAL